MGGGVGGWGLAARSRRPPSLSPRKKHRVASAAPGFLSCACAPRAPARARTPHARDLPHTASSHICRLCCCSLYVVLSPGGGGRRRRHRRRRSAPLAGSRARRATGALVGEIGDPLPRGLL